MAVICIGMILIVYMDCIRNFYLGIGLLMETLISELSNIVFVLLLAAYLCFVLKWNFVGVLVGTVLGMSLGLSVYVSMYYCSCNMREYHKDLKEKKKGSKVLQDTAINLTNKPTDDIAKLKTWKEFAKFEGSFIAILCLELFWGRIDGIILSLGYSELILAVHYSWMNVTGFVDAFSYGWGVSICEKLAVHMVAKRTKMAKALSI